MWPTDFIALGAFLIDDVNFANRRRRNRQKQQSGRQGTGLLCGLLAGVPDPVYHMKVVDVGEIPEESP